VARVRERPRVLGGGQQRRHDQGHEHPGGGVLQSSKLHAKASARILCSPNCARLSSSNSRV
jgi:hypothetical protein